MRVSEVQRFEIRCAASQIPQESAWRILVRASVVQLFGATFGNQMCSLSNPTGISLRILVRASDVQLLKSDVQLLKSYRNQLVMPTGRR